MSEWEIVEEINKEEMKGNASIRVIGVGGGGGNAVPLRRPRGDERPRG